MDLKIIFFIKPNVCSDYAKPSVLKAGDVPAPNLNVLNLFIENNGVNPPQAMNINLLIQ